MADFYPLKRFDDLDDDAQAYGPGAFCWTEIFGYKVIKFLDPGTYHASERHPSHWVPVVPSPHWDIHWPNAGDDERPELSPSIRIITTRPPDGAEEEIFHGYLRRGHLEVL